MDLIIITIVRLNQDLVFFQGRGGFTMGTEGLIHRLKLGCEASFIIPWCIYSSISYISFDPPIGNGITE